MTGMPIASSVLRCGAAAHRIAPRMIASPTPTSSAPPSVAPATARTIASAIPKAALNTTLTGRSRRASPGRCDPTATPIAWPSGPARTALMTGIAAYASMPNHQSQVGRQSPRTAAIAAGTSVTATAIPDAAQVLRASARPG
jgi:hypothetical protein